MILSVLARNGATFMPTQGMMVSTLEEFLMRRYAIVRVAWDDEAKVWFVQESDIPGLVTEAGSLEELRRKVPHIIQDLLEDEAERPAEIEIDFIAYAHDRVTIAA